MRKILCMLLVGMMTTAMLTGCGGTEGVSGDKSGDGGTTDPGTTDSGTADTKNEGNGISVADIKVGIMYIGDENEGYTESHMKGIREMKETLGLADNQIIEKTLIAENEASYDAAVDLADMGCNIIFANSFGHESYILQAAAEFPEVQFCHATGFQAASSGLPNMHNYFTDIYEARYLGGVVGGMKLQSMIDSGEITPEEAKIGYVGAYPYAEVVSGYTSFFLGARSVCPSATMEVRYTNSWSSIDLEKECAEALIADGCKLISQHADTTGAASACEVAGVPIVGYNVSMIATAPTQALTSATNKWGAYYTYVVQSVLNGEPIATDWSNGLADDAVGITELNEGVVAEGTDQKVAEVEAALKDGTLHVFDTSTWTVNGENLTTWQDEAGTEYIKDGYFHESEWKASPAFSILIDGITSIEN